MSNNSNIGGGVQANISAPQVNVIIEPPRAQININVPKVEVKPLVINVPKIEMKPIDLSFKMPTI